MNKVDNLLKNINAFIQKAEEDEEPFEDKIADFPGSDKISGYIEEYEKKVAKLLRNQRKYYVDAFNSFVSKDDRMTIEAFIIYMENNLFAADEFAEEFGNLSAEFLQMTIEELTNVIMESIDKDIGFEVLSGRTTNWIKDWSEELADIMNLNTHSALEKELLDVLDKGESIAQAELRMKDLPEFDRNRARATARTEILTASSRANWESFQQSPAVEQKKWKHSGTKKNNPRSTHVAMDGVTIVVDEYFLIDGEEGLYPRDTSFSAKNRVNCGCAVGPVVNEDIIGLSKEEKEAIRQEVLAELES
ncbi:phage minor head protein [Oceanobacillus sp. CF4.6]|uniref:phage minor head protein n=1 Tax=Oceanobacillus sp. CF4.6 TaxID=3373080 RepID=UPI003EE789DC